VLVPKTPLPTIRSERRSAGMLEGVAIAVGRELGGALRRASADKPPEQERGATRGGRWG